jgi:hypothetical protein
MISIKFKYLLLLYHILLSRKYPNLITLELFLYNTTPTRSQT